MGVSVRGMIESQPYPNWWPEFQDGTSGIMPYDFNDPRGNPPYNYYITYQDAGRPDVLQGRDGAERRSGKISRFRRNAVVFAGWKRSFRDESRPSGNTYITNTDTSGDYGTCGASPCPKPHYGSRTILFRKDLEIDVSKLKYKRLMIDSCSTSQYYLDTFQKGIVFYTLGTVDWQGGLIFLKKYLHGKSDEEIWATFGRTIRVYDYYDFNKRPYGTVRRYAYDEIRRFISCDRWPGCRVFGIVGDGLEGHSSHRSPMSIAFLIIKRRMR